MNLDLFSSLTLAGVIQGFLLSIFILSTKKNKASSSIYLGLLILSFTLSNLQYGLEEIELISWQTFNYIYIPYFFLVPPFLYFYVVKFLYPERKAKPKEKLLHLPFIFFLLITLLYKGIITFNIKVNNIKDVTQTIIVIIDVYSDFILIPLFFFVLILLLIEINNYSRKNKEFNFKIVKSKLLWLKILFFVLLATLVPWFYYTIAYTSDSELLYMPLYALTSIVIYLLGYIGIHKIGIHKERKNIRKFNQNNRSYNIIDSQQNEHITAFKKLLVNERKFLDNTITLESVSEMLNISKGHLSRIINTELNTSFSDYINTLRVEEAKSYLQNPDFSKYTLVAIGLEAGFNSKSTFNNTFKKITGITPSQYKKKHSI